MTAAVSPICTPIYTYSTSIQSSLIVHLYFDRQFPIYCGTYICSDLRAGSCSLSCVQAAAESLHLYRMSSLRLTSCSRCGTQPEETLVLLRFRVSSCVSPVMRATPLVLMPALCARFKCCSADRVASAATPLLVMRPQQMLSAVRFVSCNSDNSNQHTESKRKPSQATAVKHVTKRT